MDPPSSLSSDPVKRFEAFVSQFVYNPTAKREFPKREVVYRAPRGKSEGERQIQRILENDLGMRYERDYVMEHVFEDMSSGRRLRFDFFVKPYRLLIEFDGDQHYTGSKFHRTRTEWLEAIERDELKNEYCREKGLSLLRIPQSLCKPLSRLRSTIVDFIDKIEKLGSNLIEVDLYFKLKAGKC